MGLQWLATLFVIIVSFEGLSALLINKRDTPLQLCDIAGCNCTTTANLWKSINCTFNHSQKIELNPGSIPSTTIELFIVGGYEVDISSNTFNALAGFNLLRVDGTKRLFIRKHGFINLNSTSLVLEVQGCDFFVLESNAFKNMQTPILAEISHCSRVKIENSAFSRLQQATFQYISRLELEEGAFTFENQGAIQRHGPVTNLSFHNVSIPKIPRDTFTSALAEINIHDSDISDIYPEAFKANVIDTIFINNTRINRLHTGALSERTLILKFIISKCKIRTVDTHAIMAAITNLTVQFSVIHEIMAGAINSTITANIVISGNTIKTVATHGLVFNNWNNILMEQNIIVNLRENFLHVPFNSDVKDFSFSDNEIYNVDAGAFNSIPELQFRMTHFKFSNNFFNKTCICDINSWLISLLNNQTVHYVLGTSYCLVDIIFSRCFKIPEGLMNMKNFTELVCGPGNDITCEPYHGETKLLDTTATLLLDEDDGNSNLILGLTLGGLLIICVSGTFVILLIKAGFWLKRKGYCVRFQHNEASHEDEGAMVTTDNSDKYEFPDELTQELLASLRVKLEDPNTHDEARRDIERLYELFVVDESYTNNNRAQEEAHLYEELGNLQGSNRDKTQDIVTTPSEGAMDILKLIEEKLNIPLITDKDEYKPPLVNEYSEPTDAAVHLYSELKNKLEEDNEKKGSVKSSKSSGSNGSKMAFRPLPDKPKDYEAGPSSKY